MDRLQDTLQALGISEQPFGAMQYEVAGSAAFGMPGCCQYAATPSGLRRSDVS